MMMRWTQSLLVVGMLGAASLAAANARADNVIPNSNGDGFDTHLFRPAMDSKGFFTINGADVLGHGDISFGLVLDYGANLLRVSDQGQQSTQLINHSFQGTAHFSYGLFNRLVLGVAVPVNLMAGDPYQNERVSPPTPLAPGLWGPQALDSQTFGFLSAHAKLRLLRNDQGLGVAIAVQVGFPITGAPRNAGADPGFWYWPQLILEKRFGRRERLHIGVNGGFRGHPVSTTHLTLADGDFKDGNRFTYGAAVSYRVLDPLDLVAETYATYLMSDASAGDVRTSNEVVGGIKLFVERNSYLTLGAGPRYTKGFEAADIRGFIGFIFEPSIGDRDGDGVKDDQDKCPDQPEDIDGFQDDDGCPDPDNDHDGIPDELDKCPDVPEDKDGDQDEDGCPEGTAGDRDGDGIPDNVDKCPDQPEDRDGFQDDDGCPDPDNDGDGIPDRLDRCPNDAEDKDGFEDQDGCPDPDNDKDGIPDIRDKCPNQPETYNGIEDEDGCPDKGNVIIQENNIVILEKIKFKTGSAEILPESKGLLDQIAATMQHHPEFTLMEVAGHADERASDQYNLKLTQDRVNSVMKALVQRGIDKSRLRSKGYGEYCPEDPAHNEAAWERNRRVDFKIVTTKDGPTNVALGCENAAAHGVKPAPVP